MKLADTLAKFESSHGEDDENKIDVFDKLRNKEIVRTNKSNPQIIIRILPSVTSDGTFYKEFRNWIIPVKNGQGVAKANAISLEKDPNPDDPIQQHIDKLTQNGTLPAGKYGPITPSTSFYVNAFVYTLDPNTNTLNYRQGPESPVFVVQLGISQMRSIMEKLANPMFNPNTAPTAASMLGREPTDDEKDLSFISTALAYPIMITLGSDNKYTVDIMQSYLQGALPDGWEQWAEDLDYLAQPLYKTNPGYTEYILNQQRALEVGGNQPQQQAMPQQGFNNAQLQNVAQGYAQSQQYPKMQQGTPAPQAPQAPQTAYQRPTAPVAPAQSTASQMPKMPSQGMPAPQAPTHVEVPNVNQTTPSIPSAPAAMPTAPVSSGATTTPNPLGEFGTPLATSAKEQASSADNAPQEATKDQQISDTADAVQKALAQAGIADAGALLGK